MTTKILPDLSLKFERRTSDSNNSTNTQASTNSLTSTVSNNIILNTSAPLESLKIIEPKVENVSSFNSSENIQSVNTPDNIKIFKEYLLATLINYFKSEIILANNIIEISPNIVLKVDDLKKLIAILVCDSDESRINITTSVATIVGCKFLSCCAKLPLYRKVDEIIIDKKYSFKGRYDQYYTQMNNNFNISLDYALN